MFLHYHYQAFVNTEAIAQIHYIGSFHQIHTAGGICFSSPRLPNLRSRQRVTHHVCRAKITWRLE